MPSLKWRNPFVESQTSIPNAKTSKPLKRTKTEKKLFFPTFENKKSIAFWVGYVILFSTFGLAASSVFFKTWWDAFVFYIDLLLTYSFIVFFVVGYIYLASERYSGMPKRQMIESVMLVQLVLVPLATIATAIVKYLLVRVATSFSDLILFMMVNTVMSMGFTSLFMYYFSLHYNKVRHYQERYQRQLVEQNEQLKARIIPHFFFNMLNTMQSLIESDKDKAIHLVKHVSSLYRVSFREITEVGMLDEIELCQHYLSIEQYRFGNKLSVNWDLPDEDLLYDMAITSLTLQLVIEKMIVFVVEMTTATIFLNIRIDWQKDWITIDVNANIPSSAKQAIAENIDRQLNFDNQIDILRQFFGAEATIEYYYDQNGIETTIQYPFADVALN